MSVVSSLRDGAANRYLRSFAPKPPRQNPDWTISPEELRDVSVRWPRNYEWPEATRWMETLVCGFRQHTRLDVVDDIPQPYHGTVMFQFVIGNKRHDIAIGYTDLMPIDKVCAEQSQIYFKLQFERGGYGYSHVVPGGYVPDSRRLYFHLSKLRKIREREVFRSDVYGRFGTQFGLEIRERAMAVLREQNEFQFEGGMSMVGYRQFLQEVAQSSVCIDLPGKGDFCFRFVNYMAVGSCVIAYPHRTTLQVPLVPGKHLVYTKPDLSDLVELCEYYRRNVNEREEIARNAREFFDLYLHKDNLVRYYLRTCLNRLR